MKVTISSGQKITKKRILLAQLMRAGDCVFLTAIARQIKHDYPNCHLTWAIGSPYSSILTENPHVDEVWEIPLCTNNHVEAWKNFEQKALDKCRNREFDEIFMTQIQPGNWQNFDGTTRVSMFRGYPHPITESVTPVIRLHSSEIERVNRFAHKHGLNEAQHVILFEYAPNSRQSFVTVEYALDLSKKIIADLSDSIVILSSNKPLETGSKRLIDGSCLSFRENAELTKHCSFIIGTSSGISWLCTSDWAKKIPMIQLLSKETSVYASFIHDHEYWGIPTDNIIELTDCSTNHVLDCLLLALSNGFFYSKRTFHESIKPDFTLYSKYIVSNTIHKKHYIKFILSLINVINRYGIQKKLVKEIICSLFPSMNKLLNLKTQKND